jgi:uncharacterized protein YndB with AHSA1/START domain
MMATDVIHKSFVVERTYPTTVTRVFQALSDPKKKRRWFAEGDGFIVDHYALDFRIGGSETVYFRFGEGPTIITASVYFDIVQDQRIVFAYSITTAGVPQSSSLATIELVAKASETHFRFTEFTAFLDGIDGSEPRREGTIELFNALQSELEQFV